MNNIEDKIKIACDHIEKKFYNNEHGPLSESWLKREMKSLTSELLKNVPDVSIPGIIIKIFTRLMPRDFIRLKKILMKAKRNKSTVWFTENKVFSNINRPPKKRQLNGGEDLYTLNDDTINDILDCSSILTLCMITKDQANKFL